MAGPEMGRVADGRDHKLPSLTLRLVNAPDATDRQSGIMLSLDDPLQVFRCGSWDADTGSATFVAFGS
jgi:hypothetical protein